MSTEPRPLDQIPKVWDLVDLAMDRGDVKTIHLAADRPPMWRLPEGLRPVDEAEEPLPWQTIQAMLSMVVEPELWDQFERTGEGEVSLTGNSGRRIMLTLYRSHGHWSAVVHL